MEIPSFAREIELASAFKKSLVANVPFYPVPQTDTGGLVENTKAIGRTVAKELGKLAGRNFGRCPPRVAPQGAKWGAAKDAKRLFNKNTGLCKPERGSIGADTCPVPEG
jgi:hypothetical protein